MSAQVTDAPAATAEKLETCFVTIVNPGRSDSVIKVYPARHKTETIWLDNQPGRERYELFKRTLNNYCDRNKPVPHAAPWHSDAEDHARPDLKEQDIPLANLENCVWEPLPEDKKPERIPEQTRMDSIEQKIGLLTGTVESVQTALVSVTQALQILARNAAKQEAPPAVQGAVAPAANDATCQDCGAVYKNAASLGTHRYNKHRPGKEAA